MAAVTDYGATLDDVRALVARAERLPCFGVAVAASCPWVFTQAHDQADALASDPGLPTELRAAAIGLERRAACLVRSVTLARAGDYAGALEALNRADYWLSVQT